MRDEGGGGGGGGKQNLPGSKNRNGMLLPE